MGKEFFTMYQLRFLIETCYKTGSVRRLLQIIVIQISRIGLNKKEYRLN